MTIYIISRGIIRAATVGETAIKTVLDRDHQGVSKGNISRRVDPPNTWTIIITEVVAVQPMTISGQSTTTEVDVVIIAGDASITSSNSMKMRREDRTISATKQATMSI